MAEIAVDKFRSVPSIFSDGLEKSLTRFVLSCETLQCLCRHYTTVLSVGSIGNSWTKHRFKKTFILQGQMGQFLLIIFLND